MRRISFGIGLLFLIVVAFSLAGVEVPIRGHFDGNVNPIPIPGDGLRFHVEYTATGNLSHLGQVEAQFVNPDVELDLTRRVLILTPLWTGKITAANGDQIFGEYSFDSDEIPFSPEGDFQIESDLKVTGGTGRFQGATGSGIASISANVFDMTFTTDLTGKFSTVGSNKK